MHPIRPPRSRRRPPVAAALAALPVLAAAARADLDPEALWTVDATPIAATGSPMTRALACDLDGDHIREVVVVQDGELLAALGPSLSRAPIALPDFTEIDVLDVARLRGAPDANGNLRDVLVVAEATALRWGYLASGEFVEMNSIGGSWAGARRLATADVDGDGTDELLALNAAGTSVLIGAFDGTDVGTLATWSLPSGHVGSDLFGYRHGSDAAAEIGVTYATGVDIVVAATGATTTRERSAPVRAAVALERSASEAERLALVTYSAATGLYTLAVVNGAGSDETTVPFGFLDVTHLAAGDTDGDGDEDLHVWHRYSYDLVVLRNIAEASSSVTIPTLYDPLFDAAVLPFAPGESASGNGGALCLDDLDSDGDLDAAGGIDANGTLVLAINQAIDASELTLTVDSANPATGFVGEDPVMTSVVLSIVPDGVSGILSGNKVEVVIWTLEQEAPASEAVMVGSTVAPLNSSRIGIAVVTPVSIDLESHYVFAQVRELAVDGVTQEITGRGPPAVLWLEPGAPGAPGSGITVTTDSTKVGDILPRPILPPPPPSGGGGGG